MVTTWRTITIEAAKSAVKLYNDGTYGCLKNPDLDQQALDMFADGLGSTAGKILQQVEFIGREYGGVAGFSSAIKLAENIASDIFTNREDYEGAAISALPVLSEIPSRNTIDILYRPFIKPLQCAVKRRWSTAGEKTRPGTGSLRPVAIGAAVEATKPPEPPV